MSPAEFVGNKPESCDHIYPRTRDGRCHGCGTVPEDEVKNVPFVPFPDDSDPKEEFYVERTLQQGRLTIRNGKKRPPWRFVHASSLPVDKTATAFFGVDDNAPMRRDGDMIAVWTGKEAPTGEPEF